MTRLQKKCLDRSQNSTFKIFMFNPAVTDKTADYMFEGLQTQMKMNEARKIREQQQVQQSVGQAMESMGKLAGAFKADAAETAAVDGRTDAVLEMSKTNPEIVDPGFAEALLKQKNRGKRAAMLMTYEDFMFPVNKQKAMMKDQQAFTSSQAAQRTAAGVGVKPMFTPVVPQGVNIYGGANNAPGR